MLDKVNTDMLLPLTGNVGVGVVGKEVGVSAAVGRVGASVADGVASPRTWSPDFKIRNSRFLDIVLFKESCAFITTEYFPG